MIVQLTGSEWRYAERIGKERHKVNRKWGNAVGRRGSRALLDADKRGMVAELAVYKALGMKAEQPFVVTDGAPPVHDLKLGPYTVDVKSVAKPHYGLMVMASKLTNDKTCDVYVLVYVNADKRTATIKGWAWADDIFVTAFLEELPSGDNGYLLPEYLLEPADTLGDLAKVRVWA